MTVNEDRSIQSIEQFRICPIFYNVQALRALAAYLVVLVHLEPLLRPQGIAPEWFGFGNSGVDLFFVISGFVMIYTTSLKSAGTVDFYLNRAIRVIPMYWIATFSVFCIALLYPALLNATNAGIRELFKSLFFIPYQKSSGVFQPVLFLGWTLNYEIFFYMIFGFALYLSTPAKRVIAVTSVLALVVISRSILHPTADFIVFYGEPIVLEFAMGMWVALAHLRGFRMPRPLAYTTLILGCMVLILQEFLVPGHRVIFMGIPSAFILASALSLESSGIILRNSIVQLLGSASYALYLIHPFITQAGAKLLYRYSSNQNIAILALTLSGILIAVTLTAVLVHIYVERRLTSTLRRAVGHKRSIVDHYEASNQHSRPALRSE